jgi:hypothetical protein
METSSRRTYRRHKRRLACRYCSARHIRCKTAEPLLRNGKARLSVGSCQACIAANSPCNLAITSKASSTATKVCSDEVHVPNRRRRHLGRFAQTKPNSQIPCVEVQPVMTKTQRNRYNDTQQDQMYWNSGARERFVPEELSYNENDPKRKLSSAALCLNLK